MTAAYLLECLRDHRVVLVDGALPVYSPPAVDDGSMEKYRFGTLEWATLEQTCGSDQIQFAPVNVSGAWKSLDEFAQGGNWEERLVVLGHEGNLYLLYDLLRGFDILRPATQIKSPPSKQLVCTQCKQRRKIDTAPQLSATVASLPASPDFSAHQTAVAPFLF